MFPPDPPPPLYGVGLLSDRLYSAFSLGRHTLGFSGDVLSEQVGY